MFAIVMNDKYDGRIVPCFWTCRFMETDNYSIDREDATLFKDECSARAMAETLGKEHYVVSWD